MNPTTLVVILGAGALALYLANKKTAVPTVIDMSPIVRRSQIQPARMTVPISTLMQQVEASIPTTQSTCEASDMDWNCDTTGTNCLCQLRAL